MYFIYGILQPEEFMNLTLPSWTQGVYPNGDLLNGVALFHKLTNYNEEMKKLNGGKKKIINSVFNHFI